MKKDQKTAAELEEIIRNQTGLKVAVVPDETFGWAATAFTVISNSMSNAQNEIEAILPALRAQYELKKGS